MTEQSENKNCAAMVALTRGTLAKPGSALVRRGIGDLARILGEDRGRILLVARDSLNLHLYEQLLRADGHVVQIAHGTKQAFEIAHSLRPQVVMLSPEVDDSGVNGIRLGMELAELLPHAQMVIFMAELSKEQYSRLWGKGYVFANLPAPFTHEDLLLNVREFVNRSIFVDQTAGFLNGAYLRKNLEFWINEGEPFSIIFFALRSFHQRGQRINPALQDDRSFLGAISQQVSEQFTDFAFYRYGGNKFALWCYFNRPREVIGGAASELSTMFEETNWAQLLGSPVKLSAIVALVTFPDEGHSSEEMLARAEELLLQDVRDRNTKI